MLKRERQEYILREVNLHNRVLTSDLSEAINVSEDTIRRDLAELAETGKIIKAHGGALSKSFHTSFQINGVYSHDKKKCIARKAVNLIHDGMFILSGGGTTITELAKALPDQLQATFFTGSLPAAIEYIQHPTAILLLRRLRNLALSPSSARSMATRFVWFASVHLPSSVVVFTPRAPVRLVSSRLSLRAA